MWLLCFNVIINLRKRDRMIMFWSVNVCVEMGWAANYLLITDILLNTSEKQRNEGKDKGGGEKPRVPRAYHDGYSFISTRGINGQPAWRFVLTGTSQDRGCVVIVSQTLVNNHPHHFSTYFFFFSFSFLFFFMSLFFLLHCNYVRPSITKQRSSSSDLLVLPQESIKPNIAWLFICDCVQSVQSEIGIDCQVHGSLNETSQTSPGYSIFNVYMTTSTLYWLFLGVKLGLGGPRISIEQQIELQLSLNYWMLVFNGLPRLSFAGCQ